jgi:hypothetical protein
MPERNHLHSVSDFLENAQLHKCRLDQISSAPSQWQFQMRSPDKFNLVLCACIVSRFCLYSMLAVRFCYLSCCFWNVCPLHRGKIHPHMTHATGVSAKIRSKVETTLLKSDAILAMPQLWIAFLATDQSQ